MQFCTFVQRFHSSTLILAAYELGIPRNEYQVALFNVQPGKLHRPEMLPFTTQKIQLFIEGRIQV